MTTTTVTQNPAQTAVVNTTLNYYLEPSKGGHTSYQIGVSDYYRRKFDPHPAQVHNIRGREDEFKLETHGFQRVEHSSAEKDFDDTEQIKRVVYPETEQLIKDVYVSLPMVLRVLCVSMWLNAIKQHRRNKSPCLFPHYPQRLERRSREGRNH